MDHKTLCQRPLLPPSHMPACSAPAYKSNLSNRLLSARTGASYVVMCHCINECAGPTQKHHFFSFSLGPIVTVATTESMQQKQPTQQLAYDELYQCPQASSLIISIRQTGKKRRRLRRSFCPILHKPNID